MSEDSRTKEAVRLLRWIKGNRSMWERICNAGREEIPKETFEAIMKELIDGSFYGIVIVLFTVYQNQLFVSDTVGDIFLDTLIGECENVNGKDIIDRLHCNVV